MRWTSSVRERPAAVVGVLTALAWVAVYVAGVLGGARSADADMVAEVARRVAAGGRLYVDAVDQRGPMMYLPEALRWHTVSTAHEFFVQTCAIDCALVSSMFLLAYRVLDEAGLGRRCIVLAGAMFVLVPGMVVTECETRVIPGALLALLFAMRMARGEPVRLGWWFVVGLWAGYALWMKYTLCAMFVLVLLWCASAVGWCRLKGPLVASFAGVVVVTVGVFVATVLCSDVGAMLSTYFGGSSGDYLGVSLSLYADYLPDGLPFILALKGLLGTLFAVPAVFVVRSVSSRPLRACCALVLLVMAVVTLLPAFVTYGVAVVFVMAMGLAVSPEPSEGSLVRRVAPYGALVLGCFGLSFVLVLFVSDEAANVATDVGRVVGGDASVCCARFSSVGTLGDMGLTAPYASPAPNNTLGASEEVMRDLRAGRWRWCLMSDDELEALGEGTCASRFEVALATGELRLVRFVDVGDWDDVLESSAIRWPSDWRGAYLAELGL